MTVVINKPDSNFVIKLKLSKGTRKLVTICGMSPSAANNICGMSTILDLDEDYFVNQISNKDPGFARFNYYPPSLRPDLVSGMRPHSDGALLTIVFVFVDHDFSGLQVESDGKWYSVPAKPYPSVINLSDCMEIMCNGIFRSTVHRW